MTNTGTTSVIQAESKASHVKSFDMTHDEAEGKYYPRRTDTTGEQEAPRQTNALIGDDMKALKGQHDAHVLLYLNQHFKHLTRDCERHRSASAPGNCLFVEESEMLPVPLCVCACVCMSKSI